MDYFKQESNINRKLLNNIQNKKDTVKARIYSGYDTNNMWLFDNFIERSRK